MRRSRVDKEDGDKHIGLLKLAQILSFLLVLMAGMIVGFAASSHINHHLTSQALRFSSSTTHSFSVPAPVRPCKDEDDGLKMENFVSPKTLIHRMGDSELFWRASMVPYKSDYPLKRVPKVAFMFLTRGPLPLLPLWERFFKGHEKYFSIYIHDLPGYELNVSSDSPFYRRHIPSKNVEWGTVLLADAERRLLGNALLDFSNERFVLLSESCIPVYNFPTVYNYLIHSAYSFVDSYDEPTRYGRGRYNRKMLPDIKLYQWRKGSQWFEMQRKIAIYIISDNKYYNLFRKYCRPACYPDEHYVPTFLNIEHGLLIANRTVTWVNWSLGGPHPALYGKENVTEGLIRAIRNNGTLCSYNDEETSVCHLFARKFAPNALEPLLNLSSTVMQF